MACCAVLAALATAVGLVLLASEVGDGLAAGALGEAEASGAAWAAPGAVARESSETPMAKPEREMRMMILDLVGKAPPGVPNGARSGGVVKGAVFGVAFAGHPARELEACPVGVGGEELALERLVEFQ